MNTYHLHKIIALTPSIILNQNTPSLTNQQLNEIYNSIWKSSKPKILSQKLDLYPYQKRQNIDTRSGLTLLIDLQQNCPKEVLDLLNRAQKVEPNQTWYPQENLHLSLYSLLEFDEKNPQSELTLELLEKYQEAVVAALTDFPTFNIELKGITASNNAVLIKGYSDGMIQMMRDRINQELTKRNLPQNNRTKLNHFCIMRYTKPLTDPPSFCEFIEQNKDNPLGILSVSSAKLVINNWTYDPERTTLFQEYELK